LHKKSKESAEGAQIGKPGASASEAERVAPGYIIKFRVALKGRNTGDISALHLSRFYRNPGATRFASLALALAFTLRAFGALSFDFCAKLSSCLNG